MENATKKLWKIFLFCITLIGIYYSIYSHAYNEYAKEISSLEKKIDLAITQLDKRHNDFVWDKLAYLQNIHTPVEPNFYSPHSIYLSLFGQRVLSGEHIYKIHEIIQQNRHKLTSITFQGLILGKQIKITNSKIEADHYNNDYPLPLWYLDFTNSNFSKTHFIKSLMSQLNFENSNFQNSRHDNVVIISSRLTNSNFSKTRINESYFIGVILTDVEFSNSTILKSSFKSSYLNRSNFDNTTIIDSSFLNTKLLGVDFSKANFIYSNADEIKKNFLGALYNSKPITISDTYNITHKNVANYCALHQDMYDPEICIKTIMEISESSKVSKFPDTFNPKEYNLIDASDFIKFLKESIDPI